MQTCERHQQSGQSRVAPLRDIGTYTAIGDRPEASRAYLPQIDREANAHQWPVFETPGPLSPGVRSRRYHIPGPANRWKRLWDEPPLAST
jgi:hypothetical protein